MYYQLDPGYTWDIEESSYKIYSFVLSTYKS